MTEQPKDRKNWEDSIHYDSSKGAKELSSHSFLFPFMKTSSTQTNVLFNQKFPQPNLVFSLLTKCVECPLRTRKPWQTWWDWAAPESSSQCVLQSPQWVGIQVLLSPETSLDPQLLNSMFVFFLNRSFSRTCTGKKNRDCVLFLV